MAHEKLKAELEEYGFVVLHDMIPKPDSLRIEKRVMEIMRKRSEEHTSELQSLRHLVCRLLLEKKKNVNTSKKKFQRNIHAAHTNTIRTSEIMIPNVISFRPEQCNPTR